MDRRALLIGTGAVLLAGCARVQPGEASASPTPSPTPSPTLTSLVIGIEQSPTGALLGALLVGAVTKLGASASAQPWGEDWQTTLGSGALVAAPVWAGTAWGLLSDDEEPPADLLGDLASLLDPDVGVLAPGKTDGGLVWMAAASSGLKSLEDLAKWSVGKSAAVAAMAIQRADGMDALNAIYHTNFAALTQDDPVARAQSIVSGQAGIGAFRRTEYTGGAALVELVDPEQMCTSDQLVLLVNATFADQKPDLALAMNAVIQAITNTDLIALEQQVAQGGQAVDVAKAWLSSKGLG